MVFPWAAATVDTDPPRMVVVGKEEEVGMNEAVEIVAEAVEVVEATELVYVWQ